MDDGARPLSRDVAVLWMVGGVAAIALLAGATNSTLTPPVPAGAGPIAPLRGLSRATGLSSLSATGQTAASIAIMVIVVGGFLYALREAWRGNLSMRLVVGLGIAFQVVAVLVPLVLSRDVFSYAMYGRIAAVHHANPYVATPIDFRSDPLFPFVGPEWKDQPAVYGPAFTLISSGLARLTDSPLGLIVAFKALAGAASVATVLLIAKVAGRLAPKRAAFAVVLFAWNPAVFAYAVGGGHNDLLVALAVAAAMALVVPELRGGARPSAPATRREVAATAVLALGTMVKATAVLPLVLLLVVAVFRRQPGRRLRALGVLGAVAVGLALLLAAPFLQTSDPTLGLATLASHRGWVTPTRLLLASLGGLANAAGGDTARDVVELVIRLTFLAVFLMAFWLISLHMARRAVAGSDSLLELGAAWSWVLLLACLVPPILLPWYVVWMLPVAWLLPWRPLAVGVGMSAALSVALPLAEPTRTPGFYNALLWIGHAGIGPLFLAALVFLLLELRRVLGRGGPLDGVSGITAQSSQPSVPSRH